MDFVYIAMLMGLAGSLHCIGMCGPLHAAIPYNRSTSWKYVQSRTFNHLGRLSTYAIMGSMAGLVGKGMAAVGTQQLLSILSGVVIISFLFFYEKRKSGWLQKASAGMIGIIKSKFSVLIQKRKNSTFFLLGMLNGFLPCGLVYFALAAATATGHPAKGALFMFIFGLGTTPALLSIGGIMEWLKKKTRVHSAQWIRASLLISGMLLILRGSNLGIPYISPKVDKATTTVDCCHKP